MLSVPERMPMGEHDMSLVTIVIPVYNGSAFLASAIDSALGQTYSNVEVIVVNDGSQDSGATQRVALAYGDRIRYFLKENGGVASALNFAIREMKGDYFSWLSHDDIYCSEKIWKQISFLKEQAAVRTIVYSDYSIFTDEKITNSVVVSMPIVPSRYFRYWLTARSSLHGCTLLIPRGVFSEIGFFNESLRTTQDYDLWFRAAEHFAFAHVPAVLIHARSHAGQDTRGQSRLAFKESNDLHLAFVKKLFRSELPGEAKVGSRYLILASSLWGRGFIAAGDYCAGLAKQYGVSLVRVFVATFQARCTYWLRQAVLHVLSSQTKQKLRRMFNRLRGIQRGLKRF